MKNAQTRLLLKVCGGGLVIGVIIALVCLAFIKYGENKEYRIPYAEYFAFRETENGKWGMINEKGEVLLRAKFSNRPHPVYNGRFTVETDSGTTILYTAEKEPRKIGEYSSIGEFFEDVAPAVEKGKGITFINPDGDVITDFSTFGGEPVTSCTNFINGAAVFKCGRYYGIISKSGHTVAQPEYVSIEAYTSGYFIALHKEYESVEDENKKFFTILDNLGRTKGTLNCGRFNYKDGNLVLGDKLIVSTKDKKNMTGLMDFSGNWFVSPTTGIKEVVWYRNGFYVFMGDNNLGTINKKGEIKTYENTSNISPWKEDRIWFSDGEALFLADQEKTPINQDRYEEVHSTSEYALALALDGTWYSVDTNGKREKVEVSIAELDMSAGPIDREVYSEYLDADGIVDKLQIEKQSCMGIGIGMKPTEVLNRFSELHQQHESRTVPMPLPHELSGTYNFSDIFDIHGIQVMCLTSFPTEAAHTEAFTKTQTQAVILEFGGGAGLVCHSDLLFQKLMDKVKTLGTVVKKAKYALLVKTGERRYYFVAYTIQGIVFCFGDIDTDALDMTGYNEDPEDWPEVTYPREREPQSVEPQWFEEEETDDDGSIKTPRDLLAKRGCPFRDADIIGHWSESYESKSSILTIFKEGGTYYDTHYIVPDKYFTSKHRLESKDIEGQRAFRCRTEKNDYVQESGNHLSLRHIGDYHFVVDIYSSFFND